MQRHTLAYLGLAALFLLSVAVFAQRAYDSVRCDAARHANTSGRRSTSATRIGAPSICSRKRKPRGMKSGDAVLAVNGRPVDGFVVYYGALRQARAGDRLRVQVQSPGPAQPRQRRVDRPAAVSRRFRARCQAFRATSASRCGSLALPAVCIALGFWVAAVRIGDRSAWLLLVLLLSLPASFGGGSPEGLFGRDEHLSAAVRRLRRRSAARSRRRRSCSSASRFRNGCRSIAAFPGSNGSWPATSCLSPSSRQSRSGSGCITWPWRAS